MKIGRLLFDSGACLSFALATAALLIGLKALATLRSHQLIYPSDWVFIRPLGVRLIHELWFQSSSYHIPSMRTMSAWYCERSRIVARMVTIVRSYMNDLDGDSHLRDRHVWLAPKQGQGRKCKIRQGFISGPARLYLTETAALSWKIWSSRRWKRCIELVAVSICRSLPDPSSQF